MNKIRGCLLLISPQWLCLSLLVAHYAIVTARSRWLKLAFLSSFEKLQISAICFVICLPRCSSAQVPTKQLAAKIFQSNSYRQVPDLNFVCFLEFHLFHSEPQNGVQYLCLSVNADLKLVIKNVFKREQRAKFLY